MKLIIAVVLAAFCTVFLAAAVTADEFTVEAAKAAYVAAGADCMAACAARKYGLRRMTVEAHLHTLEAASLTAVKGSEHSGRAIDPHSITDFTPRRHKTAQGADAVILDLAGQGLSQRGIAAELVRRGVVNGRGKVGWTQAAVSRRQKWCSAAQIRG